MPFYRLSEMMGVKLRENNPAITDLNDPNRPMKLGEQFNELYENEWTEAFLELQDLKTDDTSLNEEQAVKILLNILKVNKYVVNFTMKSYLSIVDMTHLFDKYVALHHDFLKTKKTNIPAGVRTH